MAKLMLTFVSLLVCYSVCSVTSQSPLAKRAGDTASYLYDAIRRIAFPLSPELKEKDQNVDTRFILMMPGKVLNYFDYNPGPEYTKFIQNPDKNKKFAVVPPHVMENWFDLADVIPSAHPLNGQDTGRSLANIYRGILRETTIKNLEEQGEQILGLYNQALGFLNEVVPNPEDLSRNTTRLALYDQYKELYNQRRLDMEDQIESKRKNSDYIEYELWFQRHYPLLLSRVESAYVRWLIFGQKELCDIYITYLDTGASAQTLEEARIVLRSAGVTSLDRTRTIYPVDFEPSDWYKYLLPVLEKPSRAELQEMLSKIQAKIATIDSIIFFYKQRNARLDGFATDLESRRDSQSRIRNHTLSSYLSKELECTVHNMGVATPSGAGSCEAMSELSQNLTRYLTNEADSIANVGDYVWAPSNRANYTKSLEAEKEELERQRGLVEASLGKVDPLVGGILNSDSAAIASIIDSHKDDKWLQFQFDSEEYKRDTKYESSHKSVSASAQVNGWFWSAGYSYSRSKSKTNFEDAMSQASLKAKGKFLRIHIKRPWFKPEVFDDRNLNFVSNTDSGAKVYGSPGKGLSETDFIEAIKSGDGGPDDVIYRLPEYVTSFLIARDVELEFSNVNRRTVRDTVSTFTQHSGHASFFCFSSSFSYSKSNYRSTSKVHRTANGMVIKIPGAQVIGYYTQKLPKFPASQ